MEYSIYHPPENVISIEKQSANDRTPLHILSRELGESGLADMLQAEVVKTDWTPEQIELVFDAMNWSIKVHADQYRDDGQPYSTHPLRNALRFITPERMAVRDQPYVTTAILLHDTVEDNPWAVADIPVQRFDRFSAQTLALEAINQRAGAEVAVYVALFTIPPYPHEGLSRLEKNQHHYKHRQILLEQDSLAGLAMLTDPIDNAGATEHEVSQNRISKIMAKYIPEMPLYEGFIKRNRYMLSDPANAYIDEVFANVHLAHQNWLQGREPNHNFHNNKVSKYYLP